MRASIKYCVCLTGVISIFSAFAQERTSLPDPLSLEQALQLIDEAHPVLLKARLERLYAENDLLSAEANDNLQLNLEGRLRWTEANNETPISRYRGSKDHKLRLVLSKPVYDGGYVEANKEAARRADESANLEYAYIKDHYAITVMQQFFDIILADLQTATDTETMATVFVSMDRAQDNHELGKISDIDLLQIESAYQDSRVSVYRSEGESRKTRQNLALTLNRPGQQPSNITPPVLDVNGRRLPEYEELMNKVMMGNVRLKALDSAIAAAKLRVEAAGSSIGPRVSALVERSEQTRRSNSSADEWRVGVEMSMPLFDGGRVDTAVNRALLDMRALIYDRQQYEFKLRSQVREIAEHFRVLSARNQASQSFSDYRDLYMDRSRALYDLEIKTDLGDAMIQISASHLRSARQQFEMALLLAQLNLLAGESVTNWHALTFKKPEEGDL